MWCSHSTMAKRSGHECWLVWQSTLVFDQEIYSACQPPNKQMQRARTDHKCVLGYAHRRVADLRRSASVLSGRVGPE